MGKAIGIDLGTTNSSVAVVQGSDTIIIPNSLGKRLTPSVVHFSSDGDITVGEPALRYVSVDPQNTITGIKRLIGRRYNEVFDIAESVPYEVVCGSDNLAKVKVHGVEYTPQEISALILQELKRSAESYLSETVTDAVITIPAYFNDIQREATRQAGNIAGLNVIRIINEPTAASLVYGVNTKKESNIAVFDLGGGTFDITILNSGEGVIDVSSIYGDGFLGGDDFDNRIMTWILDEFMLMHDIDLSTDSLTIQRLMEVSVRAKCELSTLLETKITIPFITYKQEKPLNLNLELTRQKFEELCEELFERLVEPCKIALRNTASTFRDIDKVILVGGATRMSKVSDIARSVFQCEPSRSVNPDEAVTIGAALQASICKGNTNNLLLLDVTPHSLGLETLGGVFTKMIEANTTIPAKKSQIFSTQTDNQESVEINIFKGEKEMALNNKFIGRLSLEEIPPASMGVPQIEVTFDIDQNSILYASATDLSTGKEQSMKITAFSGLSDDELDRMRFEAVIYSDTERMNKEMAKVRNEAETLIYSVEKSLNEQGDKITELEKNNIKKALKKLRSLRDIITTNPDDLRNAINEVTKSSQNLKRTNIRFGTADRAGKKCDRYPT